MHGVTTQSPAPTKTWRSRGDVILACAVVAIFVGLLASSGMLGRAWHALRVRVVHGATLARRAEGETGAASADARVGAMPLPGVMLWAWERPDDLRAVAPANAGVAYLAGTIFIREEADEETTTSTAVSVAYRPRLQTLQTAQSAALLPVIRIETVQAFGGDKGRALASDQVQRAVEILARSASANTSAPPSIQIDFDATESERDSYVALLVALRKRLGPDAHISITALASWCSGDAWLEDLPAGTIDEAVPMLFRMGPDTPHIGDSLAAGDEFAVPACRTSLGISDDELLSRSILAGSLTSAQSAWARKRIYIFHHGTWNAAAATADLGELEKWHVESSASR
jgi:Protein of unknown function (DUF3142)